jgi:hypothetical protein
MSSSDQVPCTPGQEPIHNINGVFKAHKSKAVFEQALGIGKGSSHLTKLYSDGKNIFQSANQFIAHQPRLAPRCSFMQQKADIIMEANPGMKASNEWLHGMGLPLEYVEALFEYIPQIVGFVLTLLPIIPIIFIIR